MRDNFEGKNSGLAFLNCGVIFSHLDICILTGDTFPAEPSLSYLDGKPGRDLPRLFPILFLFVAVLTFSAKRSEHKALMMPPRRICLGLVAK